ncbi:MAG TPA: glycogen/starch synthase [bacterium]
MDVLIVATACAPLTGDGPAARDVAGLVRALASCGHEVRLALPLSSSIDRSRAGLSPSGIMLHARAGDRLQLGRVWTGSGPGGACLYAIELQGAGELETEDLNQIGVFCQLVPQLQVRFSWRPEVVHCHEWQTAPVCAHAGAAWGISGGPASVLTVHDAARQGVAARERWSALGLPDDRFAGGPFEMGGAINCLKGGVETAVLVTAALPSYAARLRRPGTGCGLEGSFGARGEDLIGVLHGLDAEAWNPSGGFGLAMPFSAAQPAGKSVCKLVLQRELKLAERHELVVAVPGLGGDPEATGWLAGALEQLVTALPVQLILIGGDELEDAWRSRAAAQPARVAYVREADEALQRRIAAGADAMLPVSDGRAGAFGHLHGMRYGAVPIVRRLDGATDGVVELAPSTLSDGTASGLVYDGTGPRALVDALVRAVGASEDAGVWAGLMRGAMQQDLSWAAAAEAYRDIYERATASALASALAARLSAANGR